MRTTAVDRSRLADRDRDKARHGTKDIRRTSNSLGMSALQASRQAAHQVERAALGAELIQLHDLEMRGRRREFLSGFQHCALETQLRELGEESEVGLFVRDIMPTRAMSRAEFAQRIAETIRA